MLDTVFLHRDNAVIRSFFDWQTTGSMVPYSMEAGDVPALEQMVSQNEGAKSAESAKLWIQKYPQNVTVWRDSEGMPLGFILSLPLQELSDEDSKFDSAVKNTREFLAKFAPLHEKDVALLFRFWMGRDTYQGISPIQSLIFIQVAKQYLTTPNLAFTFFPCAEPDFWTAILSYAELTRYPEADFEVGGKRYGVYGHDWRVMTPAVWIAKLAEKEIGGMGPVTLSTAQPVISLSREDFSNAVKQALQDFARPGGLAGNPLLRSQLVAAVGGAESKENGEILKSKIKQAADTLRVHPRDEKLFRALDQTYFHPAATQEAAAELLDLPFSTYRRHLTNGIQRLTETLWRQEIGEN